MNEIDKIFLLDINFGQQKGDRNIRDEIQVLRKNEEDTFTAEQTAKKGQWENIILLCKNYLLQSKDLYILNRMCEAITVLNGIEGFEYSIELILKFFLDVKDYYPIEEETRDNYKHWIMNRLPGYIYKNAEVSKIIHAKQATDPQYTSVLRSCIEKAKTLQFYSESFEKRVEQVILDLQKQYLIKVE